MAEQTRWVPLITAASIHGVTEKTVVKRINRGIINGRRRGDSARGPWEVEVPANPASVEPQLAPTFDPVEARFAAMETRYDAKLAKLAEHLEAYARRVAHREDVRRISPPTASVSPPHTTLAERVRTSRHPLLVVARWFGRHVRFLMGYRLVVQRRGE